MDAIRLEELATKYAEAWCSGRPENVAAFFAEDGSLSINGGVASVGRSAITAAARSFMTDLPDMIVAMDGVSIDGDRATFHWTLTGTNTGPRGTGNAVRISGFEEWTLDDDGLIATSMGYFDALDYDRQVRGRS